MGAYFIRRFLLIIPTFIGVTMIAFFITRMVPGGPLDRAIMQFRMGAAMEGGADIAGAGGGQIPEAALQELRRAFDLDKPWSSLPKKKRDTVLYGVDKDQKIAVKWGSEGSASQGTWGAK